MVPRPPMHILHKTFPGTIDKTSHYAKFHISGCLIYWLQKTDLCETTECSPSLTSPLNCSEWRKLLKTTSHDQDQQKIPDFRAILLFVYYCIKWQPKTTAEQTLYRPLSSHIHGGGNIYLDRDMEKPGKFDHFPEGTGCTLWFFIMSAGTKLKSAISLSSHNNEKKKNI